MVLVPFLYLDTGHDAWYASSNSLEGDSRDVSMSFASLVMVVFFNFS